MDQEKHDRGMEMKRRDNVLWSCRKFGVYPNGYARCDGNDSLAVFVEPGDGRSYGLRIDRKLARLLARRINQCLDGTK